MNPKKTVRICGDMRAHLKDEPTFLMEFVPELQSLQAEQMDDSGLPLQPETAIEQEEKSRLLITAA